MKIYKISQNQIPQMIPQNPGAQNDPNVQLQNLQNAQGALQYFNNIIVASETLMTDLRALEETMGIGDVGIRGSNSRRNQTSRNADPRLQLIGPNESDLLCGQLARSKRTKQS